MTFRVQTFTFYIALAIAMAAVSWAGYPRLADNARLITFPTEVESVVLVGNNLVSANDRTLTVSDQDGSPLHSITSDMPLAVAVPISDTSFIYPKREGLVTVTLDEAGKPTETFQKTHKALPDRPRIVALDQNRIFYGQLVRDSYLLVEGKRVRVDMTGQGAFLSARWIDRSTLGLISVEPDDLAFWTVGLDGKVIEKLTFRRGEYIITDIGPSRFIACLDVPETRQTIAHVYDVVDGKPTLLKEIDAGRFVLELRLSHSGKELVVMYPHETHVISIDSGAVTENRLTGALRIDPDAYFSTMYPGGFLYGSGNKVLKVDYQ